LPSRRCGAGKFIAFYQPFQVIDSFKEAHQRLRDEFARLSFAVDASEIKRECLLICSVRKWMVQDYPLSPWLA
jgi:hypothetical protein